jgi:polyphosphate kinase
MTIKADQLIIDSELISRDLSWLQFNYRVLDQSQKEGRGILDKLKFLAITASNADEFFMIRVGSLYNYLDYGKDRIDYSGLRVIPFKMRLLAGFQEFAAKQSSNFIDKLKPEFSKNGFLLQDVESLERREKEKVANYFKKIIFPMLTPMVYDSYHTFPVLVNNVRIFGVVTTTEDKKDKKKMSFIQIPQNLPRFFEFDRKGKVIFISIEEIIRYHIGELFKNVKIISNTLFRVTRNGDFTLEESEDDETSFIEEVKKKLKTRKTGRVVRMEIEENYDKWLLRQLILDYGKLLDMKI